MRLLLTIACLTSCLVSAKLAAKEPNHVLYLNWHKQCLSLKTENIDQQITKLNGRLKANNKDYLAKAYLGSAYALRAKASSWGPTKLKFLRLGQKSMDEAVAAAPNDPRVRMVRAIGYYKVPKVFKVRSIALADFKKLLKTMQNASPHLAINERQAILYYAYLTFKEEGDPGAMEAKSLCHRLAPSSQYGKLTK